MTPNELLYELKNFIEEIVKDIILEVRPVKNKAIPVPIGKEEKAEEQPQKRAAEVHLMSLPDKDAETNRIPYIVLQLLTGTDDQQAGKDPDSECKIRIVLATYSENQSVAAMDLLNLITRIRVALLKQVVIGKQFTLRKPLEYAIYTTEETGPYYFGEMLTIWGIPTINREVNLNV